MTPEEQVKKVCKDIEGFINDFEGGITEKEETIVGIANYVYDRVEQAFENEENFTDDTMLVATIIDLVTKNLDVIKLEPKEGEILQFGITLDAEKFIEVNSKIREIINNRRKETK